MTSQNTAAVSGRQARQRGVAIIGMACRVPGASNPAALWSNLVNGTESLRDAARSGSADRSTDILRGHRAGFIDSPFDFDNEFFKIAAEDAAYLDPQQRIMLELSVEAMMDASYASLSKQCVGVFVGAGQTAYEEMITGAFYQRKTIDAIRKDPVIAALPEDVRVQLDAVLDDLAGDGPVHPSTLVGNITNMIAGRIAHQLDLNGPALVIDTACSSSLVAAHAACESLYSGECEMAFVGGVNLNLTPYLFRYFEAAGPLSRSGHCRPFSSGADGLILGEGAGMVLLKPLPDALRDGDCVLAVISGSAVNNDGRSIGVMAPNFSGQLALLESTYERSGFDPRRISAIEAHGTGTRIGDSVEISSLSEFFGGGKQTVSIGSIKSNIGHLLGASGIAGLIKLVLSFTHKQLPPTLHFDGGNPKWRLSEHGLKIQDALEEWHADFPRAGAVNSFGFGGTNCHVIVEEAPQPVNGRRRTPLEKPVFNRRYFHFEAARVVDGSEDFLHRIVWEEAEAAVEPDPDPPDLWIVFGDDAPRTAPAMEALRATGVRVVGVQEGDVFSRTQEDAFQLQSADEQHQQWLFSSFPDHARIGVLSLWPTAEDSTENDAQVRGAGRLERTARRLKALYRAIAHAKAAFRVWIATDGAYAVGSSVADPYSRAVAAMALGLFEEHPECTGGLVDLDRQAGTEPGALRRAADMLAEIVRSWPRHPLALRGAKVFTPKLAPLPVEHSSDLTARQDDPVYLILGGSSGVGLAMARHLARNGRPTIILTGTRSAEDVIGLDRFPAGARLSYRQVSVRDPEATRAVVDDAFERHGRLTGVVLAAGVASFGSFVEGSDADRRRVLGTKVDGVLHLADSLAGRPVDLVCLVSSTSSVFPSLSRGLVSYAAANAFLDAFAARQTSDRTRWISISWTMWRDTGMGKDAGRASEGRLAVHPIAPDRALRCFDAVLRQEQEHAVVLDPQDAARLEVCLPQAAPPSTPGRARETAPPEPVDEPVPAAPMHPEAETDLRRFLRSLIADAVGAPVDDIDDDASFYELGLDSLDAVDLILEVEAKTDCDLNPTLLFEYDSIGTLHDYLNSAAPPAPALDANADAEAAPDRLDGQALPLLPPQHTFFVNHAFYPEAPCTMVVRVDFKRLFDAALLRRSIAIVVARHGALRMGIQMSEGRPVQVPQVLEGDVLTCHDFSGRADAEALLDELEREALNHVFSPDTAPLFGFTLVRKDADTSCLIVHMDHTIADAWSLSLVVTEVIDVYGQLEQGETIAGESAQSDAGHFSTYVRKVHARTLEPASDASRSFWRATLAGAPAAISLPYDRHAGAPPEGEASCVVTSLDAAETQMVIAAAGRHRATLFNLLLAVYFELLREVSGQEDIIIRAAMANRNGSRQGVDHLVGCLADSLPIRVALPAGADFSTLLQSVKRATIEAQKHAGPASMDLASLGAPRQGRGPAGMSPAGMSFINLDHFDRTPPEGIDRITCSTALPFSDLSLIAWLYQGELYCSWNYHAGHFDTATVSRLAEQFDSMIKTVEDPAPAGAQNTGPVAAPAALPAKQLFPESDLLHEKVFLAAAKHGTREAICEPGSHLTYARLKTLAFRVANRLRQEVDAPGTVIGILAHPSAEAVYGILGILSAHAAFLPLDPSWPDDRIEQILRHAKPRILLVPEQHLPRLRSNVQWKDVIGRVLVLGDGHEGTCEPIEDMAILDWRREPSEVLRPAEVTCGQDDLAYVMYTSGTSGSPKGVMVTHRAAAIFLDWISEAFRISEKDRFIHTSSLGFGGSIRQIFSTLLAGGTLYPAPRMLLKDPAGLLDFLTAHDITILNTVPTLWTRLLDAIDAREEDGVGTRLERLRLLLIGGEAMPVDTVRRWMDRFGRTPAVVNLYGSTETVVNATWHRVEERPSEADRQVPIGTARAGSWVLLLNADGAPCPPGELGEIWVGGPSKAKGYYREPELTAERFVYLKQYGEVFYRTGDLARQAPSGLLNYVGRSDTQVQIYGNRVELSEIEHVLLQAGMVTAAAVIEVTDQARQWLVAFVIPSGAPEAFDPAALRELAARKLPFYMVPHKVEVLDELPLNHAGKTDRRQLKTLAAQRMSRSDAPTVGEAIIADIWCDVLKVPAVDVDDDFFSIGGDSISVIEVLCVMREHFEQVPRPIDFYRHPTVRKLSLLVKELNGDTEASAHGDALQAVPAAVPDTGKKANPTSFPLSSSQRGFLLAQKINPAASPNWCAAIPLRGTVDASRLQEAINHLVGRHPMLRTVFEPPGRKGLQVVLPPQPLPLHVHTLQAHDEAAIEQQLQEHMEDLSEVVFDPRRWPLVTVRLLAAAEEHSYLLLCIHHAVGDAWSLHVLCRELLQVYDALMTGDPVALPPIRSTFADVVQYHEQAARDVPPERLETSRRFWRDTFEDPPTPPHTAPIATTASSSTFPDGSYQTSRAEKAAINSWCRENGVRPFILCLTLWARVLARLTGRADLVIGVSMSGRDIPVEDVQRLVGCFATGMPLRIRLHEERLLQQLRVVEEVFITSSEHNELPVNALAERLAAAPGTCLQDVYPFFFSFMDFSALGVHESPFLAPDFDRARFRFAMESVHTEWMLGVMVSERIRFNVHGRKEDARRNLVLDLLKEEIGTLCTSVPAQDPRPAQVHASADRTPTKEQALDAALVAYLPSRTRAASLLASVLPDAGSVDAFTGRLFQDGSARLVEVTETSLGRSGLVLLPRFADELAAMAPERLRAEVLQALTVAAEAGARSISLAGMLPSRTGYCFDLLKDVAQIPSYREQAEGGIRLTSGHAATVICVVKTVEKAVRTLNLDLTQARIGIVGFGSIGQTSLSLLFSTGPHPASVIISDLADNESRLQGPISRLKEAYDGPVCFAPAHPHTIAEEIYDADLIIGAASSGGSMLDVERLRPGTVVVDDSFPSIVDSKGAIRRMRGRRDVLITGGGKLDVGRTTRSFANLPVAQSVLMSLAARLGGDGLPGCRVESLLQSRDAALPCTHGLVTGEGAAQYRETVNTYGFQPVEFHVEGYKVERAVLQSLGVAHPKGQ